VADSTSASGGESSRIDTTVPHSARVWNYFLGGKDNYPVDREVGDQYQRIFPQILDIARTDRAFLGRAVRYLVSEAGIRQFLDIGTGLPTLDNTHEVAQRLAPETRVVYVDNDPLVLVHARALLTSNPPGVTEYIEADLRDPDAILAGASETLDFSKPVGITLLGILHFLSDHDEAYRIVDRLTGAIAPGSHLALTHATLDPSLGGQETADANAEAQDMWNENAEVPLTPRIREQIARFFGHLEMVEPGLVSMSQWRPEPSRWGEPAPVAGFCGVGRKP
jgi:O-methyltransferase involved in polyketide biosynthesis